MHVPTLVAIISGVIFPGSTLSFPLLFAFLVFLIVLGGWILVQAIRCGGTRNLFCLYFMPSILLFSALGTWGLIVLSWLIVAFIVVFAERAGAMLVSAREWEVDPLSLPFALMLRLLALVVIVGMGLFCMTSGMGLVAIWNLLPQLNLVYPGFPITLVMGFVIMVCATVIALIALVRSTFVLRAVLSAS